MQLAINTTHLADNTPDALERAAALGFKQVEIPLTQAEFGYGYRRKPNVRFYRQLRGQIDDLGLSVWSVTSLPLTQSQMFFVRARKDILLGGAGAAGLLGAKVFVARPADLFTGEIDFESYWQAHTAPPVVEGFDETWAQLANRRISFAVRNEDHWVGAPLTNQADRMARLTGDLAVGWAMDVRRAARRNAIESWLEAAGELLAVAHLYDLDDAEQSAAPRSDEWRDWLPPLAGTRLKTAVLLTAPGQSDAAITAARDHIAACFTPQENNV